MVRKIAVVLAFAALAPSAALACKAHQKQAAAKKAAEKVQLAQVDQNQKGVRKLNLTRKPAAPTAQPEATPAAAPAATAPATATAQMGAADAGSAAATGTKSKPSAKDVSNPQAAPTK
jgi:hypothetical protein